RASAPPRPFVVAIDLPSGLNPDTGALDPATLAADFTVTFAFPKIGQLLFPGANAVGELVIADIGIETEWANEIKLKVASANEIAEKLPPRARDSHKGTFGKALICAGSENYVGAAFLAGTAATRAGAGLVTLAIPRSIFSALAASAHETTFLPLPAQNGAIISRAARVVREKIAEYDALLIGPGLGRARGTVRFVQIVIASPFRRAKQSPKNNSGIASSRNTFLAMTLPPLVIDADALFALAQTREWWKKIAPQRAILTPHPGEMATLTGLARAEIQRDRIGVAKKFAEKWKQIVVLKGAHTIVAAPDDRATIIPFATPALATAGTGDVLAGTIVALCAQMQGADEPRPYTYDAAIVGAYLHGCAGKIAEEEIGAAGVVAGDLLTRLPRAWERIE
ncbi:MAG: NAD(P)H-hydrate dehydratase, partial [Chloroflexi bacterium]|nr:NAD(P)H-hydrate dehydratase [Chloroflexota bacterium]